MQHYTEPPVRPVLSEATSESLARSRSIHLALAGVGCESCRNRVRNALLAVAGVLEAEIGSSGSVVQVWVEEGRRIRPETLAGTVSAAGRDTHHRYLAVPLRKRFANRP